MLTHAHQSWSAHRLPGLGRRRRCEGRRARRLGPRRGSPRAWARMAGNSLACERAAAAGSACEARRRGRCGASPSLGSRRPRLTAGKRAPNSRRISPQTISRVHRANSNRNCRGSAPHDQRVQAAQLGAVQLRRLARHRPGPQRLRAALPVLGQPPEHRAPGPSPTRPPPPLDAPPPRLAPPPAPAAPRASRDPACGRRSRSRSIHADCLIKSLMNCLVTRTSGQ